MTIRRLHRTWPPSASTKSLGHLRTGVAAYTNHDSTCLVETSGFQVNKFRYGIFCTGTIFVSSRVNSNCKVQLLKTPCPPTLGGVNVQRCAAARAARAKYLLGPADSSSAPSTLPDRSTSTLTLTLTVPRMVFLADSSTSGIALWATSPWTGAPIGDLAVVFVSSS